jgi:single-strand DNA-binding protein
MAGTVNKVILVGHLGQDVKLAYTQGGTAVGNFSLATDESYKDAQGNKVDRTEWHRVVVWQKLAELCNNYLKKGSKVYIEGKIQTRQWEKDGVIRYTTEVVANQVVFLDRKDAVAPAPGGDPGHGEPPAGNEYGGVEPLPF